MQAVLVGLVFAALFILGLLTVSVQTEALEHGYRIQDLREKADALERHNRRLRLELSMLQTPSSLFAHMAAQSSVGVDETLMPPWNLMWAHAAGSEELEMAHRPEVDEPRSSSEGRGSFHDASVGRGDQEEPGFRRRGHNP